MKYTRSVPAAVLAVALTAACSSDAPVGPQPGDVAANRGQEQAALRTPDDEFARASRNEAPGFAGYYLREDGTPVILVTDETKRGEVQRYLARELAAVRGGRNGRAAGQPVFVKASHDFAQLKEWSEKLHPMLERSDVYLIDVDEVGNRVSLGVADANAIGAVRQEATRLGIPASAVHVETQAKPEPRATVRDRFTTTVGGIQIAFGSYVCTLGFNARRVSTNANIYVTNAHCTGTQYASDGIAIYQNTVASGNQIGNEIYDRGLYACISGVLSCRQADAAYISNNGTRTVGQGGIARTAFATGGSAPLTTIGEFDIIGRNTSLAVGAWLDKTGRTSGSTYGKVTSTCVTIGVLRCQDISKLWSMGGDSGSPVYVWIGGAGTAENDVRLHGVMWGGPGTDYTITYSSRLAGIEADLGALTNLCRPGYGC